MILSGEDISFLIFTLMAISGAVLMLNLNRVIHMVLSIGLSFFGVAGLFILLHAEYLAFVQVLIYAGAITIMMALGTMMTQRAQETSKEHHKWHTIFAVLSAVIVGGFFLYGIYTTAWPTSTPRAEGNNVLELGTNLFQRYVIPFELASILLLVALVGAVVLAKKESEE